MWTEYLLRVDIRPLHNKKFFLVPNLPSLGNGISQVYHGGEKMTRNYGVHDIHVGSNYSFQSPTRPYIQLCSVVTNCTREKHGQKALEPCFHLAEQSPEAGAELPTNSAEIYRNSALSRFFSV
jgi:hypothetical protein